MIGIIRRSGRQYPANLHASIAEQILAPGLGQLLIANPGLSLELDTSNQNLNFSQWEADLAIRLGKPAKGAFSMRKLADLRLYLFQPKSVPADAEAWYAPILKTWARHPK